LSREGYQNSPGPGSQERSLLKFDLKLNYFYTYLGTVGALKKAKRRQNQFHQKATLDGRIVESVGGISEGKKFKPRGSTCS